MILKYIKLENIRSYLSSKIDFPKGTVMLSGDIGCGKSTILLAAEFALFGIMKGDISGETLLRNGKNEGIVELSMEINNKDIIIHRKLKRGSMGVKQSAGYIIINGIKKEGTATELKSSILELLGYPQELLTKSKGLIYRYTVYTPQEEMKKILFEDQEARLNTLRKVFDVDKYRRIRENAKIYVQELKGKTREIEGYISDLEERKSQLDTRTKEIFEIDLKIQEILPKLTISKDSTLQCKKEVDNCEKEMKEYALKRNELVALESDLKNKLLQRQRNKDEIEQLTKNIELMEKEIKGRDIVDVKNLLKEKDNGLRLMQETKLQISRKIAEMNSRKSVCEETKSKVSKIDNCPLCLQNVSHDHKKSITERENEIISKLTEDIKINQTQEKEADSQLLRLRNEIDELRKKEIEAEAVKVRIESIKEKKRHSEVLLKEQEDIKKTIGAINVKKMQVSEEISLMKDIDEKYSKLRKLLEETQNNLHRLEIEHNTFATDKKGRESIVESLTDEIKRKEESKLKLKNAREMHQWIDTHFVSLMALMEKQVMAKVYHSFNELFRGWFDLLMEDEAVSVRLDDSFTPVVQQNGYDTNIGFLSGGEKTSCALAYRLALNKVINDLISTVHTKDIIILDEPTDGFSTEQLDRVREVIDQLDMKQVLIVSHEQKVEGFVDSVIRITKNEHVSTVV